MELADQAYKALEDIVGAEYITKEPAIRDTYNQVWGNKIVYGEKWSTRPAAVLLPGNTEEIQAIVKVCNRYLIPFKPFSSGFEIVATAVVSDKAILLDLRRMSKILEIDVENMYAIVEPYVSVYRLQIEAAKHGLFAHSISAGPSTGAIASSCCHFGGGTTGVSCAGLDRNVLGVEWVLPTGDILRLGSVGTGDGWFCGDGPGISLRGVMRGRGGANGGHGVITKACIRLYPWYGPPQWKFVGALPSVKRLAKVPDGYKVFVISFPDKVSQFNAIREISQQEIAFALLTVINNMVGLTEAEGNDECWEYYQKMNQEVGEENIKRMFGCAVSVVLGVNSDRGMEYREKCLLKISEKWGGELIPEANKPESLAVAFGRLAWNFGNVSEIFRTCGEMFNSPTTEGSEDVILRIHEKAVELVDLYCEKGALLKTGTGLFHHPFENYSTGSHIENTYMYDPYDPESFEQTRKLIQEAFDPLGKFRRYGVPALGGGLQIEPVSHVHQNWGPVYDNYDYWLRKIKQTLDPNNVGDWAAYIPPIFP